MVAGCRRSSSGGGNGSASSDPDDTEEGVTNIKVAVRCRPMSPSEKSRAEQSCFRIENGTACLENPANPTEIYRFGFDLLYGGDTQQVSVWKDVGVPALEKAFAGFNTTIFAYGQTGSGKTFSMQGVGDGSADGAGIIPRMNKDLFDRIAMQRDADANKMFLVTCSYFEIYNEVVYDLLDPNNRKKKGAGLEIREHGVLGIYVKGLQEMVVTSPDSLQRLIDQGMASRTVGSTAMNDTSSRSHSVFTVKVHQKDATDETKSTFAKINLVDLAGSERAKSTGATGARLKEGANINKSLSSLGNVINALVEVANGKKRIFVPYRNSKLTRVLQESLGGNSLTAMLAALSPAACNFEETLSTLKYASRAKSIKVNAVKNEEASQVSRLEEEIRLLKQKLAAQQKETTVAPSSTLLAVSPSSEGMRRGGRGGANHGLAGGGVPVEDEDGVDRYKQQIAEMEAAMRSTWEEKSKQSETSERERERLQQQLEEEGRREERERKKRWRALEDKGDLELSIREAKDAALPMLPASDWLAQVRELVAAESRAKEEATVCAVYREALAREVEEVFSEDSNIPNRLGDPNDDRALVASTACTRVSETEIVALGQEGLNGTGVDVGEGIGKAAASYEPALLRQLQARLTSLRDTRERLHGPLARAVAERSERLLGSVEAFAEMYAATSSHEHVEDDKDARKDEGTRALAMIRRQVLARRRRGAGRPTLPAQRRPTEKEIQPQQQPGQLKDSPERSKNNEDDDAHNPILQPPADTGEASCESGKSNLGVDNLLRPAAAVLLRAIEKVLSATAISNDTTVATGQEEGTDTEKARYLETLEALRGAHGVLRVALKKASASASASASATPTVYSVQTGGSGSSPTKGCRSASGLARQDEEAMGRCGEREPAAMVVTSGVAELDLPGQAVPDASQWEFQCSPEGWAHASTKAAGEIDSEDGEEELPESDAGGGGSRTKKWTRRNNSPCSWFTWSMATPTVAAAGEDIHHNGSPPWVEVDFGEVIQVRSLVLQPMVVSSGSPQLEGVRVSGIGKDDVDGSVEKTEAMVGEVLGGWKSILKSTSPSKLLSRPPVRFLFDIFRAVAVATGFGHDQARDFKWNDFPGKKEKTRLMDGIIRLVVDALELETPPAKGSDIVIGQECAATNRFLQLLALAARYHENRSHHAELLRSLPPRRDSGADLVLPQSSAISSWVESVSICTSEDGVTWEALAFARDGGTWQEGQEAPTAATLITLTAPSKSATARCRYIKLTSADHPSRGGDPLLGRDKSLPESDDGAAYGAAPAGDTGSRFAEPTLMLRVGVASGVCEQGVRSDTTELFEEFHQETRTGYRGRISAVGGGRHDGDNGGRHERLDQEEEPAVELLLLDGMRSAVDRLLQQSLELLRIEAANQERKMAMRTNKMESLEKRLKASNEAKSRLAREKKSLSEKASRIEEDNLRLQEEVLRLTADVGRERVEKASVAERLGQAEGRVEEEKGRVRELEEVRRALDGEVEDLQNQVEVLTEERDVARTHEEELFAKLTDKTDDLEALQESYVSLTDRWNEFQDEHDEVLEQVERYRTTFTLSGNHLPSHDGPTVVTVPSATGNPNTSPSKVSPGERRGQVGATAASNNEGRVVRSLDRTVVNATLVSPPQDGKGATLRDQDGEEISSMGGGSDCAAPMVRQQESPRSSHRSSSGSGSSPRRSTPQARQREHWEHSVTADGSRSIGISRGGSSERGSKGYHGHDGFEGCIPGEGEVHSSQGFTLPAILGVGGRSGQDEGSGENRGSNRESQSFSVDDRAAGRTGGESPEQVARNYSSFRTCGDSGGYYEDDFDDFLEEEEEKETEGDGAGEEERRKRRHQQGDRRQLQQQQQWTLVDSIMPSSDKVESRPARRDSEGLREYPRKRGRRCQGGDSSGTSGGDRSVAYNRVHCNDPGGGQGGSCDSKTSTLTEVGPRARQGYERRRKQGGGDDDEGTISASEEKHDDATPLVEVVYRPPSESSRGASRGERPKSAARQGRAASFNS